MTSYGDRPNDYEAVSKCKELEFVCPLDGSVLC